ncbi:hypothetical protein [Halotia branconii]|uniref:Uncharacterized protein n=1 Tax=Halotia branconii CENA392 TaxID=1539056 RepID=A0AAJ6NNV8_9CYAN|nr:hypothetical protein [Halotia branconii]WGV23843.1 hypothetical protein QI031_18765 [Halotia branconii CENA392]
MSNSPRPKPQSATQAPQALFCQSGKSGQVNNKALVLSNGNRHLISEALCMLSENWEQLRSKHYKKSPLNQAKCKNYQAASFVKFARHSPKARKLFRQSLMEGNPQDRTSLLCETLRAKRSYAVGFTQQWTHRAADAPASF